MYFSIFYILYFCCSSESSGNCLFSAASLVLVGNNTLVEELRSMVCLELFMQEDFYCEHPLFLSFFGNHKDLFSSKESLLKLSVSDESFNGGSSGEVLVKAEAINCCRDKKWSSFLCILALSSVINRRIQTFYRLRGS